MKLTLVLGMACLAVAAQTSASEKQVPKPGVKEVQVPFASLKPSATIKIGHTADWALIADDAVWVAGTKPDSVVRIDPASNKVVAKIPLPGEACSGLAFGFGSVWVPICGKKSLLVRIDVSKNKISATMPFGPAGPEQGIAVSDDSVWIVTEKNGALVRIDPATNKARQKISIPPGSFVPLYSDGIVWITGFESSVLTAINAATGEVLGSIPVGPKPRFLTAGGGSIWTLNQGDGTVSRIDAKSRQLVATIPVGIPGHGGDICYGADSVWPTAVSLPLSRIEIKSNKVLRQWVGRGGDSVRFGFDSIWLTDYDRGLLWRIPYAATQRPSQ